MKFLLVFLSIFSMVAYAGPSYITFKKSPGMSHDLAGLDIVKVYGSEQPRVVTRVEPNQKIGFFGNDTGYDIYVGSGKFKPCGIRVINWTSGVFKQNWHHYIEVYPTQGGLSVWYQTQ